MRYGNIKELKDTLKGIVDFGAHTTTKVLDTRRLREEVTDRLVYNAVFNEDGDIRDVSRWLIYEISNHLGIRPASIKRLYELMAKGEVSGFTVPAINIRALTYDVARAAIRSALRQNAGAVIFEIARSEIDYTQQRPVEYAVVVLGSAIKENYRAPVFLQGDHFQIGLKRYQQDPVPEVNTVKALIREAIEAGFYNIDIDTSTLVDLSKRDVNEQQRLNFELAAELTAYIRTLEPEGITISVSGEIGEVGGKNSTVEDFRSFMDGYTREVKKRGEHIKGISKISVQTGSSHGGVPLPDGSIAEVELDFTVHSDISKVAKQEYGLAGTVQHGASTLPDEAFDKFPQYDAAEIHLATGFQNIIYDSEFFPAQLRDKIYAYIQDKHANEREPDQTREQFIYKTRKKALGPFKEAIWNIPEELREKIGKELERKFDLLFKKLNVHDTLDMVKKYAITADMRRPVPSILL
jgi:fructose/tagatose bisphosphate aldolase